MADTLRGVIAPMLTPFDADGRPDGERFCAHARRLLDAGCTALAAFGTTGEATSLGLEERGELLAALLTAGIDPAQLLIGTGSCSLPDSVRLTRDAVRHGCAGVLLLPPFYYKSVGDEGLFRFVSEVIEQVGDARLRVYLYHIPPQAVIGYSLALVGRLREAYPQAVVGIKDSSGDWRNTAALLEAFPGFATFSGSDDTLLANLRGGGAGCITATANVNAGPIRALYDTWRSAEADALQAKVAATRELIQRQPLIPMLKHIVARDTDDDAWLRVRPPLVPLSAADAQPVLAALG